MRINSKTLADDMYSEALHETRPKPVDMFNAVLKKYKSQGVTRKDCKKAMKRLIDSGKLVYSYYNGCVTFLKIAEET